MFLAQSCLCCFHTKEAGFLPCSAPSGAVKAGGQPISLPKMETKAGWDGQSSQVPVAEPRLQCWPSSYSLEVGGLLSRGMDRSIEEAEGGFLVEKAHEKG